MNQCNGALSPGDSCVAPDYAIPKVPIAALPGVGSSDPRRHRRPVAERQFDTDGSRLEGAIDYAQTSAQAIRHT